jgi:hypothetical protein
MQSRAQSLSAASTHVGARIRAFSRDLSSIARLALVALVAVVASAAVGCEVSERPPRLPRAAPSTTPSPVAATASRVAVASQRALAWDLAAVVGTLRSAARRSPSEHGDGSYEGEVLVNDPAAPYPTLGPATRLPEGALVVEAQHRRDAAGSSTVAGYLLMRKREPGYDPPGGDWEYGVADETAAVRDHGVLPLCARCHAEAPHDHLFAGR